MATTKEDVAMVVTKGQHLAAMKRGEGVLARIDKDEPIFILRARDVTAPALVLQWAILTNQALTPNGLDAMEVADQMRNWQRRHPDQVKWPD